MRVLDLCLCGNNQTKIEIRESSSLVGHVVSPAAIGIETELFIVFIVFVVIYLLIIEGEEEDQHT